jgi:ubiquinone/menaquinone biosynthesis C-methylase UbiE
MQRGAIDIFGSERMLLDRLDCLDGARVLEVGCGDGRLTARLAARACKVVALDPDAAEVGRARRHLGQDHGGKVRLEVGSALDLRFLPGSFDAVLFTHSL